VYNNYDWVLFIIRGASLTIQYSILPLCLGIVLGTLIAMARMSHVWIIKSFAKAYVSIIRGTPLILQLSICYFLLPRLLQCDISPFVAGITAFSLNSAAYISEVMRAGIAAIDRGQFEAARTLDIPAWLTYRDIILPQAVHKILPALLNEMISLVKESAIIGMIGGLDIMRRSVLVSAETYTYFAPLLVAAASYYVLISILTCFTNIIDRKLHDKYQ
jgi:His/Glu/Gln/Arg/opine family amino acid ABC transporter permease subunit